MAKTKPRTPTRKLVSKVLFLPCPSRGSYLLDMKPSVQHLHTRLIHSHTQSQVRQARDRGFRLEVHAIGDRAVSSVLDAFEEAGLTAEDRPIVTHCQVKNTRSSSLTYVSRKHVVDIGYSHPPQVGNNAAFICILHKCSTCAHIILRD